MVETLQLNIPELLLTQTKPHNSNFIIIRRARTPLFAHCQNLLTVMTADNHLPQFFSLFSRYKKCGVMSAAEAAAIKDKRPEYGKTINTLTHNTDSPLSLVAVHSVCCQTFSFLLGVCRNASLLIELLWGDPCLGVNTIIYSGLPVDVLP